MVGKAICTMIEFFGGARGQIAYSLEVYGYARVISLRERLEPGRMQELECAAVLHNVGILESERVFGSAQGACQERMSAKVARELMTSLHFQQDFADRVAFLIRYHRSHDVEGGKALQILREAVLLARCGFLEEPELTTELSSWTRCGGELLYAIYGIRPRPGIVEGAFQKEVPVL